MFDPTYLNLSKDDPDAWKIYAEKVRSIMSKCLRIPTCEYGYRTSKEFSKVYAEALKRVIMKNKGKALNKKKT